MKAIKRLIVFCVAVLMAVMATATCLENVYGNAFVSRQIYGTWWFSLLWGTLTIAGSLYIWKTKLHRRIAVFVLHLSFVIILVGALTSHLTALDGSVHLRKGQSVTAFELARGGGHDFGFSLELEDFSVVNYPGTDAPMDYLSVINVDGGQLRVSMNHIGRWQQYRFIQAGYDSDMDGTRLEVHYDPYGIFVTYAGYALLLLSIILLLCGNFTKMREYFRKASAAMAALLLFGISLSAGETPSKYDTGIVREFGNINLLYDGRVSPVNTIATEFVTKLSGKASWNGYSAMQIFMGWAFNSTEWESQPMIRIKDKYARKALGIDGQWASHDDFWNEYNRYKLEDALEQAYRDGDQRTVKHLRDADEKFNLVRMFYNGEMLRMFPYKDSLGVYTWLAPGERNANVNLPEKDWYYVRKSMDYLTQCLYSGDIELAATIVSKIQSYQAGQAPEVILSKAHASVERVYNGLNAQRWPTMLYMTFSLVLAILFSIGFVPSVRRIVSLSLLCVMLAHVTALLGLRWLVSGHVPMSNGYETMQTLAFALLLGTLLMHRKFPIILGYGPLLASFALLVAMISGGNPKITNLMPVLQSPLLSVHVMVIMISYALFAMILVIGIQGFVQHCRGNVAASESFAALSHFLLYPAVFMLTIGIFLGAVWANVSWGSYWTWDPKEVWALITLLVYMLPLHGGMFRRFNEPKFFHLYCIAAFLCVLITYFGVNFFLGGMHSYA